MDLKMTVYSARRNPAVKMRVFEGHFATKHSHVSHCIDLAAIKSEMNMARAGAKLFAEEFRGTMIDTIITMDRTKMIGAFLATELSHAGINLNKDIAVVTPELTGDVLILRDNLIPYVKDKHVLILTATTTTGVSISKALDTINHYDGTPVGAATIFGSNFYLWNVPVVKLFGVEDIENYQSWAANECPLCQNNVKVDGLINSYGYSKMD